MPTAKTAARMQIIRAMAERGCTDLEIGLALGISKDYVQQLRSRYGAPLAPTTVNHGTPTAYRYHRCRCDICREANTERARQGKADRQARLDAADISHGLSAYSNWGCRCAVCCAAQSESNRATYLRRQARTQAVTA